MRRFVSLTLLLAAGMVYAQDAQEGSATEAKKEKYVPKDRISSPEFKVSNQRIDAIAAVIQKYYDDHAKLESPEVISQIKEDIAKIIPVTPAKKPDNRTMFKIREDVMPQVEKKYPSSTDEIRRIAEQEAIQKYPMVKRGDVVTLYYKRGRSYNKVQGHFYGFGIGGKSVRINSGNIPYFDLTPESKALFDKNANAEIRKEYAAKKVNEYLAERLKYFNQLYNAEVTRVRQSNEKLGYIYRRGKWEPAEIFINEQLKIMTAKAKVRDEAEALKKKLMAERLASENPNAGNGEQGNNENNNTEADDAEP